MSDSYSFQNPNSGWPMTLRTEQGRHVVECDEMEEPTPPTDTNDALEMTAAVRNCADVHEAALVLREDFAAADILD